MYKANTANLIQIIEQDAYHQYDEQGRAITTWDAKKCAWIVNFEFESESIDWYGKDSDFPAGYLLAEYEAAHPNWNKMPDISVTWYWNDKASCIRAFGQPYKFLPYDHLHYMDFWDIQTYPYCATRYWGDMEYDTAESIEHLGKYCHFNENADRTVVKYNDKIIFDGKLK